MSKIVSLISRKRRYYKTRKMSFHFKAKQIL